MYDSDLIALLDSYLEAKIQSKYWDICWNL